MLHCTLHIPSNARHLTHLFTGFHELHRHGIARVTQVVAEEAKPPIDPANPWRKYPHALMRVVLNGNTVLCYDTHDSGEIHGPILDDVDFYFKRSFAPGHKKCPGGYKIHPLGLFYSIYTRSPDLARVWRSIRFERGLTSLKRVLKSTLFQEQPHLGNFHAQPRFDQPPRVLFLVRAWDPMDVACPKEREERCVLNASRTECIRLLRRELGDRFVGGFEPSAFALKEHAAETAENPVWCRDYLNFQKAFPVGVATTGLHGSIGAKFAEYIAQAKAIISEPLRFQPPGPLAPNDNYLEFTSPEQCVAAALRLIDDADLRFSMMMNNYRYYQAYLRPDALVLNSLAVASMTLPLHAR